MAIALINREKGEGKRTLAKSPSFDSDDVDVKQISVLAAVIVLSGILCAGQKQSVLSHSERYVSPDGEQVAVVRSERVSEATDESRVELRNNAGAVSAKRDYSSSDGEHGYGVTKAAWTPDSQYFVFSLESSGGHQGWHTPVRVFSRRGSTFFNLDRAPQDSVSNPQFLVSAPDRITVELYFSKHTRTVALRELKR